MLTTAQIGAAGVLLIQYRLLKSGIDSAILTTDAGIDLVAYSAPSGRPVTIQVKTCLQPKPSGGKGAPTLDWWLRADSPAEFVGLVSLEHDAAWLLTHSQFEFAAQQKPSNRLHLYFYTDDSYSARAGCHIRDFDHLRIESTLPQLIRAARPAEDPIS